MKINADDVNKHLAKANDNSQFYLVYGADTGLVSMLSSKIVNHYNDSEGDSFNIHRLEFDDIKSNVVLLSDKMMSMSLLGGRTIVVIENSATASTKDLTQLLKHSTSNDAKVIFEAGELAKSSSLRKNFETLDNCVAIPCYKPDARSIKSLIMQYMKSCDLHYNHEITEILANIFPANRLLIQNEIEKLSLYKGDNKEVTIEDINSMFAEMSEHSYDDVCTAIISKNKSLLVHNLAKLKHEDVPFIVLIRVVMNFFYKVLILLNTMKEKSKSANAAVLELRPPVFFKQKTNVINAANALNVKQVKQYIKKLLLLEVDCKSSSIDPDLLYSQFMLIH